MKFWKSTDLAKRSIGSIRQQDLIRLRDELALSFAPATIVRRFAILSNLFTIAKKDWLYAVDNPVLELRKPKVRNERTRRLFTDIRVMGATEFQAPRVETEWIAQRTQSKYLYTIVQLAIETAMRRSEIVRIRREHINFENGTLWIPESKNGEDRTVPLSPVASYALMMHLMRHNRKGQLFPMDVGAVSRGFLRAIRRARVDYEALCAKHDVQPNERYFIDLRFHDLRHEATSRLAEVYEMHELAKITGHKDTRMLLRYYHPDGGMLARKLANSSLGQQQLGWVNRMLLGIDNS
ncbi:Tyrosine recombinase XerC [Oligella sp. MSHR50489EDL]|uniref:tyrosine-type recombinase/integrase n=1 Tax=Oligella sp. MSHR50489EDL TaxID=3139409 RepID=UPI003D8193EC